ncbi:MAG: cupin domain-containing protein [Hyphomicrobium sp.]
MSGKSAPRAGWKRTTDQLDLTGMLGEKLRGLREMRELSLGEASSITGVPRPTLSRIENNKMAPTIAILCKVVAGYGVPWSTILPDTIIADRPAGRSASFSSPRTLEVKLGRRSLKSLHPSNPLSAQLRTFVLTTAHKTVREGGGFLSHPFTKFCYVLEGSLTVHFKGQRPRRLEVGESALFPGDKPHAYTSHTGKPARFLLIATRLRQTAT